MPNSTNTIIRKPHQNCITLMSGINDSKFVNREQQTRQTNNCELLKNKAKSIKLTYTTTINSRRNQQHASQIPFIMKNDRKRARTQRES